MNKHINLALLAIGTISAAMSITSCEDEPNKFELSGGNPTIHYIRPQDVDAKDSLLLQAYVGSNICIVGENLTSIREMYFNDVKAILNTSYITSNTLLVTIPSKVPANNSGKIYMVNKSQDTTIYDFKVLVPAPAVNSMRCEYIKPGEETTLKGQYFVNDPNQPLSIKFTGINNSTDIDVPASNIKKITDSEVTFIVPDGIQEGLVEVSSIYGTGKSKFYVNDRRGMLFDFDTPNSATGTILQACGWHNDLNKTITTDENSLSGNYLTFGKYDLEFDGNWNDGCFCLEYWLNDGAPDLNTLVDFSDFENMSVKFEICVPSANPWTCAPMQVIFASREMVQPNNNTFFHGGEADALLGWPRALYAPWTETGTYGDNKWETVTLPLGGKDGVFNKYWDGSKATKAYSKPSDFASLTIFIVNGGGFEGKKSNTVIRFDNFRVVPNL